MEKVPGLMRLGLSSGAPVKGQGFTFLQDPKGRTVAFERPSAAAISESALLAAAGSSAVPFKPEPAKGTEPFVPARLALAGQKLTFRAFFAEAVPESALESSRKRHLIVVYYLEDDSLEVLEPGQRNDGMTHGKFLKRMKVPTIGIESLRVGSEIELFGRVLHVYACDDFTRKFYDGVGQPQGEDEPIGDDAWTATQRAAFARNDPDSFHGVKSSSITRFIEAVAGSSRTQSFKKDIKGRFLQYDSQVLRFLVVWDDRKGNNFGEKHLFWMSYFLATESVEIKETKGKKQIQGWPTLLRRMRLPRFILAHDDRMRSAEDVTGDEDYYNEDDFLVGQSIHVFGRQMLIADCDKPTAHWYLVNKGVDQKAHRIETGEPEPPKFEVTVPPHIGIGSEEDTLESWKHLIPRQKPVDFNKLRNATGDSRKFLARLISSDPINAERVFRLTVFLDDEEVAIFEPPVRNSGIPGGIFQKKKRTKNDETGEYFKVSDFAVGRTVVIKAHRFAIFEEERGPEKAVADVDQIIATLKTKLLDASASLRKMFRKFDLDHSQTMSFEEFSNMLNYYSLGLTKYEAIVLFKAFEDKPGFMSYNNFMLAFSAAEDKVKSTSGAGASIGEAAARMKDSMNTADLEALIEEAKGAARAEEYRAEQEVLLGRIARTFKNSKTASEVHSNFRRFDVNKDHLIEKSEFRQVMGHGGLFLTNKDIDMLIDKFYANGAEFIDYEDFMGLIHEYSDKIIRS